MALFRKKQPKEAPSGFTTDEATAPRRPRLTPVDVQERVFRLAFRGYNEREVDEFLDLVTEDLAALHEENKRLREELDMKGGGSEDARRHAEETVRRARQEAARIVEEAETRGGGSDTGVSAGFLARERGFLQEIASLVQEHADALKDEARRIKREAARARSDREAPDLGETQAMSPAEGGEEAGGSNPGPPEETGEQVGTDAESAPAGEAEHPGRMAAEPAGGEGEPSLKELFWGED